MKGPTNGRSRALHPGAVPEKESDFQTWVIDYAQWHRWRVAHFRPAKVGGRWMTPVAADGAGFPDLVLVREGRLVFAELKQEGEQPEPAQWDWLRELALAGQEVWLWSPSDRPMIERTLE